MNATIEHPLQRGLGDANWTRNVLVKGVLSSQQQWNKYVELQHLIHQ